KMMKDVEIDENAFKPIEAIIYSMTKEERNNPDLMNGTRKARIAAGSGTSIQQVNNLLKQFEEMRKMVKTMNKTQGKIPNMKMMKDVEIDENAFKPIEAIIYSMTKEERNNPDLMNGTRKARIAAGSGTSIQQVNNLLKQFEEMRKMVKTMNKTQGKIPNMNMM